MSRTSTDPSARLPLERDSPEPALPEPTSPPTSDPGSHPRQCGGGTDQRDMLAGGGEVRHQLILLGRGQWLAGRACCAQCSHQSSGRFAMPDLINSPDGSTSPIPLADDERLELERLRQEMADLRTARVPRPRRRVRWASVACSASSSSWTSPPKQSSRSRPFRSPARRDRTVPRRLAHLAVMRPWTRLGRNATPSPTCPGGPDVRIRSPIRLSRNRDPTPGTDTAPSAIRLGRRNGHVRRCWRCHRSVRAHPAGHLSPAGRADGAG